MKITEEQEELLFEAWAYCDEEDKSTEFMLQYMSDVAEVDYEDVFDWIMLDETDAKRDEWYKKQL